MGQIQRYPSVVLEARFQFSPTGWDAWLRGNWLFSSPKSKAQYPWSSCYLELRVRKRGKEADWPHRMRWGGRRQTDLIRWGFHKWFFKRLCLKNFYSSNFTIWKGSILHAFFWSRHGFHRLEICFWIYLRKGEQVPVRASAATAKWRKVSRRQGRRPGSGSPTSVGYWPCWDPTASTGE